MHKYLQSYICSFIMMCHYNNIVMKTLSLQVQSKITQTTLLSIYAQYAPSKVGIKQSAIYLQIDENKCGEFTAHIKNGAFPELKYEIFQVLESPLNIQGCFEKCQEVFTSITQIKSFFLSQKLEPIEKKQQENEVSLSTNSVINSQIIYPEQQIQESNIECSNTILLDPVYESSEVIRIDFEDDTSPTRQHISIEPEAQSQELEVEKTVKIQLQEKFPPAVRSSNEDTSQFIQPKLVQNKGKDETEQKKNINKAINPKEQAFNNFMLLFLSLWIIWLII